MKGLQAYSPAQRSTKGLPQFSPERHTHPTNPSLGLKEPQGTRDLGQLPKKTNGLRANCQEVNYSNQEGNAANRGPGRSNSSLATAPQPSARNTQAAGEGSQRRGWVSAAAQGWRNRVEEVGLVFPSRPLTSPPPSLRLQGAAAKGLSDRRAAGGGGGRLSGRSMCSLHCNRIHAMGPLHWHS